MTDHDTFEQIIDTAADLGGEHHPSPNGRDEPTARWILAYYAEANDLEEDEVPSFEALSEDQRATIVSAYRAALNLPVFNVLNPRPLTDAQALDLLNYMLSAPEWSVSMLEDAAVIVRATGRQDVPGARWGKH